MNDNEEVAETNELVESLDEFCRQQSVSDKRVELIAAFYAVESAAKRMSATVTEFSERFEAFANAEPIKPKDHVAVK